MADARITHRGARGEGRRSEEKEEKRKKKTEQPELHTEKPRSFASPRRCLSVVSGYLDDLRRGRERTRLAGRRLSVARSTAATKPPPSPPPLRVGEILSRVSLRVRYLFAFLLFGSDRAMSADSDARDLGTRRLLTSRNRRRVTLPPLGFVSNS